MHAVHCGAPDSTPLLCLVPTQSYSQLVDHKLSTPPPSFPPFRPPFPSSSSTPSPCVTPSPAVLDVHPACLLAGDVSHEPHLAEVEVHAAGVTARALVRDGHRERGGGQAERAVGARQLNWGETGGEGTGKGSGGVPSGGESNRDGIGRVAGKGRRGATRIVVLYLATKALLLAWCRHPMTTLLDRYPGVERDIFELHRSMKRTPGNQRFSCR